MTDEAIMQLIQKGQLDKISELYERYHLMVYNYFVKLSGDRDTSKDLVQNTFLRIIKYHGSFKESSTFKNWLFQIARNIYYDHYKEVKLVNNQNVGVENLFNLADEVEEGGDQKESILYAALSKMSREDREILILSKFQKYKYQDIGKILTCSENTVKARVFRAIKKLKQHYFEMEKLSYGN